MVGVICRHFHWNENDQILEGDLRGSSRPPYPMPQANRSAAVDRRKLNRHPKRQSSVRTGSRTGRFAADDSDNHVKQDNLFGSEGVDSRTWFN